MVVGYDAYHDKKNSRSYGAVVSSTSETCTNYLGQVNVHMNKEELSDKFSVNIRSKLNYGVTDICLSIKMYS